MRGGKRGIIIQDMNAKSVVLNSPQPSTHSLKDPNSTLSKSRQSQPSADKTVNKYLVIYYRSNGERDFFETAHDSFEKVLRYLHDIDIADNQICSITVL